PQADQRKQGGAKNDSLRQAATQPPPAKLGGHANFSPTGRHPTTRTARRSCNERSNAREPEPGRPERDAGQLDPHPVWFQFQSGESIAPPSRHSAFGVPSRGM